MIMMDAFERGIKEAMRWVLGKDKHSHVCPHCKAGVSRMVLVFGGVRRSRNRVTAKMQIFCRDCQRRHTYKGIDREGTELYLQLLNNNSATVRSRYGVPVLNGYQA